MRNFSLKRTFDNKEHSLENKKSTKKSKKELNSSFEDSTASDSNQSEEQEFFWPYTVINNEEWKSAAIRAASSWSITVEHYVNYALQFLSQNKRKYGRAKNLRDLILFDKPLNDDIESPEFAFK